jgi:hypothetical protein
MTANLTEQLAALSEDALEAENIDYRMQCEAYLSRALVNAYRANQLAVIGPDAVELMARAMAAAIHKGNDEKWLFYTDLATAAIAALTGRV